MPDPVVTTGARPVGRVDAILGALHRRRRALVAIALGALVAILLFGPNYGDLQTAAGAEAFRSLLPDQDHGRYLAAVAADLVFAAAYGAAALGYTQKTPLSRIGGALVAVGALFDQAENIALARNISAARTINDSSIEAMRRFGELKYLFIVAGLATMLGAYLWSRRTLLRQWLNLSWKPYLTFTAFLIALIPATGLRLPILTGAVLAGLVVSSGWLNKAVTADRDRCAAGGPDHGPARWMLALVQLAAAWLLIAAGSRWAGDGLDGLFFLGVALGVMSLGAFVSELRQNSRRRNLRGPAILVVSLVALTWAATTGTSAAIPLAVLGLILGELGTELATEDYQRIDTPVLPGWVICGIGIVIVAIGASLFSIDGVDPAHLLPLMAIIALFVFFAAADGDALILVILIAVALVWSTSPKGESPDPDRVANDSEPYFVVFGDSYISGEGADHFIPGTNEKVHDPDENSDHTHECRRSTTAWPFVLADMSARESSPVPDRVLFLACSGAVTENIHTDPRLAPAPAGVDAKTQRRGPAELALYRNAVSQLGHPPEFAVISIGGNDAGFGDIGQTCVAPGSCAEVGEQFLRSETRIDREQPVTGPPGGGRPESLVNIDDDLDAAYQRIKTELGEIPVVAVPYPMPLTGSGRCSGALLDENERRFIRGFVTELNAVIKAAAARNNLLYMEPMARALDGGAQLCSEVAGRAGLNFLALNPTSGSIQDSLNPKNWTHNSLHPNADGHRALADAAWKWFETHAPLSDVEPPDDGTHEVKAIGDVLEGGYVPQCDPAARPSCRVDGSIWVGEQVRTYLSKAVFPLVVSAAGLWLCLAPLLRGARRQVPPVTFLSVLWPGTRDAARRAAAAGRWVWRGE